MDGLPNYDCLVYPRVRHRRLGGQEVLSCGFRTGNRDLFVMSADGTGVTCITSTPSQDRYPFWKPDGNSLVYHSDATGEQELWIISRSRRGDAWGKPRQLTTTGGLHGHWSPDGSTIAYGTMGADEGCWIIPATGGAPRELAGAAMGLGRVPFVNWSPDGKAVYVKSWDGDGRSTIWSVPIDGSTPRQLVLFDDRSRPSGRQEFATDGEQFYFTIAEQVSDVFMLELGLNRTR